MPGNAKQIANHSGKRLLLQISRAIQLMEDYRLAEVRRATDHEESGTPTDRRLSGHTGWQARFLAILYEADGALDYGELAGLAEGRFGPVNKSTISQALRNLTNAKWIERKKRRLVLTPQGCEVAGRVAAVDRAVLSMGAAAFRGGTKTMDQLEKEAREWMADFRVLTRHASASQPSPAGIYDALIGGSFNHAIDRASANDVMRLLPWASSAAICNRAFLRRSVSHLARSHGADQFLDLGAGLPTTGCTHELAVSINPDARVVYVDSDDDVVQVGKAVLRGCDNVEYASCRFDSIGVSIDRPEFEILDFDKPIVLVLAALLHFVPSDAVVSAVLGELRERLATGSFIVISHGCRDPELMDPGTIELSDQVLEFYSKVTDYPVRLRTYQEIASLFDGWKIMEPPGLQFAPSWVVEPADEDVQEVGDLATPEQSLIVAGVAELVE